MDVINQVAVPHRMHGEHIPLSFAQQGFWLTNQLEPGNAFSNIAYAARLKGRLDAKLLERCLNEIVAPHCAGDCRPSSGDRDA